jgi:hypothetical protein
LVTAIIKARSEGIKKGDFPSAPIEFIVRKFITEDKIIEEKVLRFDFKDAVNTEQIERVLIKAVEKITQNNQEQCRVGPAHHKKGGPCPPYKKKPI